MRRNHAVHVLDKAISIKFNVANFVTIFPSIVVVVVVVVGFNTYKNAIN